MDYDTRKKLLFSFMTSVPDGVLLRYKRPEYLSDDAARGEVNDLIEDLNSKIPDVDKDQFFAILGRFKVNLRQLVASRNWPTIPQALRAIKAAVEDTPAESAFNEDEILNRLANQFKENGQCLKYLVTADLTRKLYSQHDFNLWDMRRAGFPMDANLVLEMEGSPKGQLYIEHHYGALAKIWGVSIDEAKARDGVNAQPEGI